MKYTTLLIGNLIGALACTIAVADEAASSESVTLTHTAMGTQFVFTLYARPGDDSFEPVKQIADEAFAAIDDLERRISSWLPESQTTYLNNRAGQGSVKVGTDLVSLIQRAKKFHAETDGAFDCTVGPLLRLYGFYDENVRAPDPNALARTLPLIGMDKVHVDSREGTVSFEREGMRLDFGGIGKGLALDRAVEILRARGVHRALLHGGTSTVYALGTPPNEPGWKVRIRHPYNEGEHVAEVLIRDESLSTSGCYGESEICDILDPRTGHPVVGTISATAIAPLATQTDALSTSFLVLGLAGAQRYCESTEGVRAVVIPASRERRISVEWIGFNKTR